jgi:hypothetical protein
MRPARAPAAALAPAPAQTLAPPPGAVLLPQKGDLRELTREEAVRARYSLDAHDSYHERAAFQIATLEMGQEVWEKVKRERIDRGELNTVKDARHMVEADLSNVGNLIGSLLFGD